jgi:protein-disulfide isomerase
MVMNTKLTIPLAIAVGGIIVAGALYATLPKRPAATGGNPALVRPVDTSDHILGNPAAPVVIIEYADFDCEYCKGFDATLRQTIADAGAGGKVAWVFREFPLTELHPNALALAEAAECAAVAGGNDAFWRFADALYAHQPADPTQFGALAQAAGVPGDAFATCYADASTTVSARIMADRQNALDTGATGAPYSLIVTPGKAPVVVAGSSSYDAIQTLLDQALTGYNPSR